MVSPSEIMHAIPAAVHINVKSPAGEGGATRKGRMRAGRALAERPPIGRGMIRPIYFRIWQTHATLTRFYSHCPLTDKEPAR